MRHLPFGQAVQILIPYGHAHVAGFSVSALIFLLLGLLPDIVESPHGLIRSQGTRQDFLEIRRRIGRLELVLTILFRIKDGLRQKAIQAVDQESGYFWRIVRRHFQEACCPVANELEGRLSLPAVVPQARCPSDHFLLRV